MLYIASFTCVSHGLLVRERGLGVWLVDVDDRKCVADLWTGDSTGHTTSAVPGPPQKYILRHSNLGYHLGSLPVRHSDFGGYKH